MELCSIVGKYVWHVVFGHVFSKIEFEGLRVFWIVVPRLKCFSVAKNSVLRMCFSEDTWILPLYSMYFICSGV